VFMHGQIWVLQVWYDFFLAGVARRESEVKLDLTSVASQNQ
jgi:hypothetical protein